ncbi:TRAP transporter substrate-binding protein [Marispirochaeta aestuarii]|nr:TRAP transporter substrate-binding protein DctP [Marispirochaeta aestuarii]
MNRGQRGIVFLILIVLTFGMLIACGGSSGEDATAEAAAPKKEVIRWRLQSWAPAGDRTYEAAQRFAEVVEIASDGQLLITPYTAGSVIPGGKEFDSVMSGSVEAVHGPPGWTIGYLPGAVFFTQYPGGLTSNQLEMWMKLEGRKIAQDLYDDLGVHYVGILTLSPAEVWAHSTKPLRSVADIKGWKVRLGTTALNAIFQKMGATPVFLPGGEIYESAKRGVIDGFEYINPSLNWDMGFHEVAKYMYLSPSRAPTDTQCIYVNGDTWDKLPENLKTIVTMATDQIAREYYTESVNRDVEAVQKYIDAGTIVEPVPQDIIDLLNEKSLEYFQEESAKDPNYKRIYDSAMAWKEVCERFDIK